MNDLLFSSKLLIFAIVFHINGVGAAVQALYLNAPTAFVHQSACATANGAALQFIQLVIHNFSYLKMVSLVS
jgi:hypothetical protein